MDKIVLTKEDFIRKAAETSAEITGDFNRKEEGKAHAATAMTLLAGLFTAKLASVLFDKADEAEQQEEMLEDAINKEVNPENEESEKRISEEEFDTAVLEILEEDAHHHANPSLIMLETTCFAQLNRKLFGVAK